LKILAVETSTEYCSVALWQYEMVQECGEKVGQKHSEVLIAMLDELLKNADVRISQLDGIAFGKGPGSFTGVRIACGVAQGLALGLNLNVVGVCTLQALAKLSGHDKVIAALDARMGEIYFAVYKKQSEEWVEVIEPCLCKIEHAPTIEGAGWFGVGSGFAINNAALAERYTGQMTGIDVHVVPQAGAVAQLAAIEFAKGNEVDAALALPLYLRDKVALKTSER
jgi:tRNA threonylcarbamoyladenosine biosynthesis protein TsaB